MNKLITIMLLLCATTQAATQITLIESRGDLTNRTAYATNTLLSAKTSEFFSTEILTEDYDMVAHMNLGFDESMTNGFANLDFDCISHHQYRWATLVAPDVAVSACHARPGVGYECVFGGHTAVVTQVIQAPNYTVAGWLGDYTFLRLDREVPVKPAQLVPKDWLDYFDMDEMWQAPLIIHNRHDRRGVEHFGYNRIESYYPERATFQQPPQTSIRLDYNIMLGTGSSGAPIFILRDGKHLNLLGVAVSQSGCSVPIMDLMPVKRGWVGE